MSVMLVSPPEREELTRAEAAALTAEARAALCMALEWASRAVELVKEAWEKSAHLTLGYESWEAYCETEFAGLRNIRIPIETRAEMVMALREVKMATRQVGAVLRISDHTVREDIKRSREPHPTAALPEPATRAEQVLDALASAVNGLTWIELGQALRLHHGQSSAALTRLHQQGRIVRTAEYRQGSAVYRR